MAQAELIVYDNQSPTRASAFVFSRLLMASFGMIEVVVNSQVEHSLEGKLAWADMFDFCAWWDAEPTSTIEITGMDSQVPESKAMLTDEGVQNEILIHINQLIVFRLRLHLLQLAMINKPSMF